MSTESTFSSIVIGAGIVGSATAYHLAKNGHKTLLLEQFLLPHSRGSSHGHTRITRRSYPDPTYTRMMTDAFRQWEQLEKDTNRQLFYKVGFLGWARGDNTAGIDKVEKNLQEIGAIYERLDGRQTMRRFPMLRCRDGYQSIYEPGGGMLMADKCLEAYRAMFTTHGGVLQDNEEVLEIVPGQTVTVRTNKGTYRTSSVVVTAGPWTNKLTSPIGLTLPLQPTRIAVYFWKVKFKDYSVAAGFPSFSFRNGISLPNGDVVNVYGIPEMEYPNHIKICAHGGPPIDPNARDTASATWALPALQRFIQEHFPGVETTPSVIEPCIYTMTPDKDFILDVHPKWPNIAFAAGFSGSGFKLAPVVGESLAALVVGRRPSHDLEMFKLARFRTKAAKSVL